MPIPVTCPSCKTSFTVGDQHAGKKGPCPKCKAIIAIPKLPAAPETKSAPPKDGKSAVAPAGKQAVTPDAKQPGAAPPAKGPAAPPGAKAPSSAAKAAPMPEVKIHEPEASGPKGSTGRAVSKPITRKETKIALVPAMIAVAGASVTLAVAWIARETLQANLAFRGLGLALISAPLAAGGYTFLRDDELEPYRGRWLWFRSFICSAVYVALWGGYHFIPADFTREPYFWVFIAIPFFSIGAGAAFATLDLDFTNGFFHYCFYVLATLLLGWIAGLPMPWTVVGS